MPGTGDSEPGYPALLPVRGRLVTVVGGGPAAVRRVAELRAAGAQVVVAGAELGRELDALAAAGSIVALRRDYRPADLDGSWLVLACSGDPLVDAAVERDAQQRRIWCVLAGAHGQRILVLGGARSGKSTAAEAMLAGHDEVDYLATGPLLGAGDPEWDARVAEHRERRPASWRTTETLGIEAILDDRAARSPVLIDCLATWLTRVMDECGCWHEEWGGDADKKLALRLDGLLASWEATRRHVIAVSNEVGSGVVPGTASGRRFRDELGMLNARLAGAADEVWLCTAGLARRLR